MNVDLFDEAYKREGLLFGDVPSRELVSFLDAHPFKGSALDLGCGDGRESVPLLKRGFSVTAIDKSSAAIAKLLSRTDLEPGERSNLTTIVADIRSWAWPENMYDLIVATTILDHLPYHDILITRDRIAGALKPNSIVFVQVHTVDDPAVSGNGVPSEFASAIKHYFGWNELLDLFRPTFRVLYYSERCEWDYDHGSPHQHGFSVLIGKTAGKVQI